MSDLVKEVQAEDELEQTYDTANPEQVNKARKKAARTRAYRLEFVKAAMELEQGRSWFYDLLRRCHIVSTPYISGDSHSTAFRCGEQNVGLQLLDDIQTIASDDYIKMMKENK